jgi:hypothetical protein
MGLAILPREMRDAIFEQLYVRETAIEVHCYRLGQKTVFDMPTDEALYLSQLHVGREVASEAADIFYKRNLFQFSTASARSAAKVDWSKDTFEQWWDTDHYGSDIVPRDIVRRVNLKMQGPLDDGFDSTKELTSPSLIFQISGHLLFEAQYTNFHNIHASQPNNTLWDHRDQLRYLLSLDSLHEVHLTAPVATVCADQLLRLLSPYVLQLKEKSVKVFVECIFPSGDIKDVSHFFDTPSQEDQILFETVSGRPRHQILGTEIDPVAAWWALSLKRSRSNYGLESVEPGFVRVWLHEHYDVFQFYRRHRVLVEQLERIKDDVEMQDQETRRIRRDHYARVIDMMSPSRS